MCSFLRTSLFVKQKRRGISGSTGLLLALQLCATAEVFATESPAAPTWRPKDGIYAASGKDLASRCQEWDGIFVQLAEQSIGMSEISCTIVKFTDTAPGPSSWTCPVTITISRNS